MTFDSRALRAAVCTHFALVTVACGAPNVASVGAVLGRDNETNAVYVREAPPGMGASEAGIVPGDRLLMLDGLYVGDMTTAQLKAKLRGEPGTTVAVTLLRGDDVKQVRVTRRELRDRAPLPPPREERIAP